MKGRALLFAALALASRVSRADDASDLEGLLEETVVETASKSATESSVAPAISTTLTAEDMRRYGIHSLDEALDFLSLGVVTSKPLSTVDVGGNGVMLTGDNGSHFLLLVNGHAVNEPLFGIARYDRGAAIPFEMIDHVEVILGPGSVLYGSNAMLGVINVITKRAKDFHGVHAVAESEIGKSYRIGVGAGYELGRSSELTIGLEYYRQSGPAFFFEPQDLGVDSTRGRKYQFTLNGPRDGVWGGAPGTHYGAEVPSLLARFRAGDFEVGFHVKTFKRYAPYSATRDFNAFAFFDDPNSYELDRHAWIDATYKKTLSPIVHVSIRAYSDTFDYQRYDDTSYGGSCYFALEACRLHVTGASRWAGTEVQSSFDWLHDARLVTLLGVDGRARYTRGKYDTTDLVTGKLLASSYGVVHGDDEILGAYLQQTWQPVPWLGFNAGGRLDEDPRFRPVASPRFAASGQVWKGGTLKAIYAEAFRSPSWGETSYSSLNQIVARDLVPETVRSLTGSFEQKFGPHRALFAAFRSRWNNMIELHVLNVEEIAAAERAGELLINQGTADVQYRNVASVDTYGFNAALEGVFKESGLRYAVNVTGAQASVNEAGTPQHRLPVVPTFYGNARASYDLPGAWPTVALALHWLNRRPGDRAFDSDFPVPPYVPPQLEARATLSGPMPLLSGLSYRVSADVAVSDRAPYVIGPGQSGNDTPTWRLAPVDSFRTTVGLQYDVGGP
jgi:outer membrane receptor protein involved in Fe transport